MDWRARTRTIMEACKTAFGESVTFTPLIGSPQSLTGIIEEEYEQVDVDTGASIISQQPMVALKITDLNQEPKRGDGVTMRGVTYKVIEVKTDGQATYELFLHRATI